MLPPTEKPTLPAESEANDMRHAHALAADILSDVRPDLADRMLQGHYEAERVSDAIQAWWDVARPHMDVSQQDTANSVLSLPQSVNAEARTALLAVLLGGPAYAEALCRLASNLDAFIPGRTVYLHPRTEARLILDRIETSPPNPRLNPARRTRLLGLQGNPLGIKDERNKDAPGLFPPPGDDAVSPEHLDAAMNACINAGGDARMLWLEGEPHADTLDMGVAVGFDHTPFDGDAGQPVAAIIIHPADTPMEELNALDMEEAIQNEVEDLKAYWNRDAYRALIQESAGSADALRYENVNGAAGFRRAPVMDTVLENRDRSGWIEWTPPGATDRRPGTQPAHERREP